MIDVQAGISAGNVVTKWSSQDAAQGFPVFNPATGEVVCHVQGSGPDEVDRAVRSAQAAFEKWRWSTAEERSERLLQAAARLSQHADEIARLTSLENGKPVADARSGDVESLIRSFRYFGSLVGKQPGEFSDHGAVYTTVVREPFGVVAGIVPFNWPPVHTGAKVAPALAAGNAIVLKPGEQAPLTVLRIVELIADIFPSDLIVALPGLAAVGAALVSHPLVRKISFTGAPSTGTAVLKAAAERHTPALMELGGKNAFIVFANADLEVAARDAVEAAFFNKGEACTAASRLLVARSVHDAFVSRVAELTRQLVVGDGADPDVHVGPVISTAQRDKVNGYIDIGVAEGAKIFAQADLPDDPRLAAGYYVKPTLFTGVTSSMRVAQEEIFGPVTCVLAFDSDDEAVDIANGTQFGLVAGVYSKDLEHAHSIARRLDCGMVLVNNYFRSMIGSPFGGTKSSGFGREHHASTLLEFSYPKAIRVPSGRTPIRRWRAQDKLR